MRLIIAISWFAGMSILCTAQDGPLVIWWRDYGGESDEFMRAFAFGPDEAIYMAGDVEFNHEPFNLNAWVAKLDTAGTLLWSVEVGEPDFNESAQSIVGLADGGCLAAINIGGEPDPMNPTRLVVRYTATGDTVWTRGLHLGEAGVPSLLKNPADETVFWVHTHTWVNTQSHRVFVKMNIDGDSLEARYLETADLGGVTSMIGFSEGYVVCGSGGAGTRVSGLDQTLAIDWQTEFSINDEVMQAVAIVPTRGICITGYTQYRNSDSYDALMVFLDVGGDPTWMRIAGAELYDEFSCTTVTECSDLIAAGYVNSGADTGADDLWVARFDTVGHLLWTQTYGDTTYSEKSVGCAELRDASLIFAGTRIRAEAGNYDFFLMRTEPDLLSSYRTRLSIANDYSLNAPYPNPFNASTTIRFEIPVAGMVKLNVYDITGRLAATPLSEVMSPGAHAIQFDASHLSSGVYFCRMEAGEFMQTVKMVVLR